MKLSPHLVFLPWTQMQCWNFCSHFMIRRERPKLAQISQLRHHWAAESTLRRAVPIPRGLARTPTGSFPPLQHGGPRQPCRNGPCRTSHPLSASTSHMWETHGPFKGGRSCIVEGPTQRMLSEQHYRKNSILFHKTSVANLHLQIFLPAHCCCLVAKSLLFSH